MARFFLIGLVLLISACAPKYPPALSFKQQSTYKLERVVVIYPDEADLWWGRGDRQLAAAAGQDVSDTTAVDAYMDSPAAQRDLRDLAAGQIEPIIFRQINPVLRGSRPAQLSVKVASAFVSSPVQQVLIGGNHSLAGDVQLFDIETGEPLTRPLRLVA